MTPRARSPWWASCLATISREALSKAVARTSKKSGRTMPGTDSARRCSPLKSEAQGGSMQNGRFDQRIVQRLQSTGVQVCEDIAISDSAARHGLGTLLSQLGTARQVSRPARRRQSSGRKPENSKSMPRPCWTEWKRKTPCVARLYLASLPPPRRGRRGPR